MLPLFGRALALAALGAALGLLANALRPDGIALVPLAAPTVCASPEGPSGVEVLPPRQAVSLCGDPGVLIADARASERFAAGHVAGAIHLPCAASGREAERALAHLGGKHTLIVYGESTDEARPVAEDIQRRAPHAARRVVILDGGFEAWNQAGLACSSGPCPDCKEGAAR